MNSGRPQPIWTKLLLAGFAPILFLVLIEGLLQLADVGYPTRFLVPDRIGDRVVYRDNLFFTYRFFHPALARSASPIVVDRQKPADVFRVVVLGESAAQGDPAPEFGVSRVLEPLLAANLATGRVEVINAAVTAINSPVILEIARDLPRLQPDLVILYIGNNEVIGPFGPGTVFTRFFDADWVPRLAMRLSRLRLPQVLRMTAALALDRRKPQSFGGVEMFLDNPVAASDARLAAMHRRFRRNIQQLSAQAEAAGARVLISSVAVNLADCPPTTSFSDPALPAASRAEWQHHYDTGLAARAAGEWNQALDSFQQAAALDPGHAQTVYLAGQCLDRLDRRAEANGLYRRARDLDGLRYRTDAALNGILRDCAREHPGAIWVDAEAAFHDFPDARDADLFVDHVHFTFAGTCRLARLWAEAILGAEPLAGPFRANPEFPTEPGLREQLLFTPLAELALIQPMLARFQRPPFDRQLDREIRMDRLREQAARLSQTIRATDLETLRPRFQQILRDHPGDPYWAKQWGQWLLAFRRYTEVAPELADSIARHPHLVIQRALTAQALAALGKPAEAADQLTGWNRKHGFFVAAEMGSQVASLAAEGRLAEALAFVRQVEARTSSWDYRHRVRQAGDQVAAVLGNLAQAKQLISQGRDLQAAPLLEKAHQILRNPEPSYWLGGILARRRQNPMPQLRQAFQIWGEARSAYHSGLWRAKGGDTDDARAYFDTAAGRAGDDFELIRSLAWIYLAYPDERVRDPRRVAALIPALERGRTVAPDDPVLMETLAAALAADNQWDRSAEAAGAAIRLAETRSVPAAAAIRQTCEQILRRELPAAWPDHQAPMNVF